MLLDQFRSFYFMNYPDDMERLIETFSIFGGLGWEIDTTKDLHTLIQEVVLQNFEKLESKIEELIFYELNHKRLLRALAVGDRRIFSAFNRAGLNNGNGGAALNFLQEKGLIQIEYSREEIPTREPKKKLKREEMRRRVSHKVLFTKPFVRFWFYFVYPYIKEIKAGMYDNFFKSIEERITSYTSLIFEELSELLLNYHLRDSAIVSTGSYWDAKVEIDILTLTEDGSLYVAECKWTNHKVNKKELHKIMEKCEKLSIVPTQLILFSKRGFSNELLQMQGKNLALYGAEDFEILLKNASNYKQTEEFVSSE